MEPPGRPFAIRAHYPHRMAEACQHFVGSVLVLRPESFASDVRMLLDDAPVPLTLAEALCFWTSVRETVTRGAVAFHTWFHTTLDRRPCAFALTPLPAFSTYALGESDRIVVEWAEAIDGGFAREHAWPPAVRAALLLESNPRTNWYVSDIARCVHVSAPTLERSFDRVYGITVQQYQSLLRVRAAAFAARGNCARLEGHLLDLGCRSTNDVYRPLRRLTGMTLGELRRLDDEAFQFLLRGPLAVPLPGFGSGKRFRALG
ncbi:MAG: helix-turn-helix transcriptional regulator [Vicinamibacterales bacterium]